MATLYFSGTGTSSTAYYASDINVVITNDDEADIATIKISFKACVSNGGSSGTSEIYYYLNDEYAGESSTSLTSSYQDFTKTLQVPSSTSTSSVFNLTFKVISYTSSYPPVFHSIAHVSNTENTPTEYTHTIDYYKDGSYYTSQSTTSTSTSVNMSLRSLPSTSYYNNGSTNFTITGDKNGGISNTTLSVTKTSQYKKSWSGWYKGSSSTSGTQYSSYTVSGSVSFNAVSSDTLYQYIYSNNTLAYLTKPTKNSSTTTYTVTFNPNGGNVSTTSKTATKTTPYIFSHWSSSASGGETYSDSTAFYSDTTVFAQWTAETATTTTVTDFPTPTKNQTSSSRTITFDANGGSCSITTATSTNTTYYTFNGWYTATSGGTEYTQITPSSDTTLYAQWSPSSTGYDAITLPTPTRTNYTFSGWQDSSGNIYSAGTSYTPSATTTLTATWAGQTYYVKYNGNGHTSGSMSNSSHTVDVISNLSSNSYKKEYTLSFDVNYTNDSNLLPSGYTQLDYIESNGNQFIDTGYNFTSNNVHVYMDIVNLNSSTNATICGAEDSTPAYLNGVAVGLCGGILLSNTSGTDFKLNIGSTADTITGITIPNGERTEVDIFSEVETDNNNLYQILINSTVIASKSSISYYKNDYNYYIFANNNSGSAKLYSSIQLYRFTMYDEDFNSPVRDFIPCKRNSDNIPGLYDLITQSFYQSGSGIDLIAGNEINSSGNVVETFDDVIVSYAFQGWYSNSNGTGSAITQANNLTTAGNTYNVYAKWLQGSFTLPIPIRTGYTFLGWFDVTGNLITSDSLITSDYTLIAHWDISNTNKIIIYTNNEWKKAIALIYKNNSWQKYNFNI